jgi:hypothetical protein
MTDKETAVTLAALRMAQDNLSALNDMPHMENIEYVDSDYINTLCEEINCPDFIKVGSHQISEDELNRRIVKKANFPAGKFSDIMQSIKKDLDEGKE